MHAGHQEEIQTNHLDYKALLQALRIAQIEIQALQEENKNLLEGLYRMDFEIKALQNELYAAHQIIKEQQSQLFFENQIGAHMMEIQVTPSEPHSIFGPIMNSPKRLPPHNPYADDRK